MIIIDFVAKFAKKFSTKEINKSFDNKLSTTNDLRTNIVKRFLLMMILINETKIELTTKKMFANDFHNIKVVNVTTLTNAIDLTIINNNLIKTLIMLLLKDFRNIAITKFCLNEVILWSNEIIKKFRFREKTLTKNFAFW